MRATGIVRRIDDLGRVVIPKEIRRTMRIQNGCALEIFTEGGGEVIFKKYSPVRELGDYASDMCESLRSATGAICILCDREGVVAAAGVPKKAIAGASVSKALDEIMAGRSGAKCSSGEAKRVLDDDESCFIRAACPIICRGDVTGCVVIAGDKPASGTDTELRIATAAADFIGRQLSAQ